MQKVNTTRKYKYIQRARLKGNTYVMGSRAPQLEQWYNKHSVIFQVTLIQLSKSAAKMVRFSRLINLGPLNLEVICIILC